jgi:hypothetical protein
VTRKLSGVFVRFHWASAPTLGTCLTHRAGNYRGHAVELITQSVFRDGQKGWQVP